MQVRNTDTKRNETFGSRGERSRVGMAGRERRRGKRLTKFDKEGWNDGWNERTGEQAFYGACTGCRARSDNVCLSSRLYVDD